MNTITETVIQTIACTECGLDREELYALLAWHQERGNLDQGINDPICCEVPI